MCQNRLHSRCNTFFKLTKSDGRVVKNDAPCLARTITVRASCFQWSVIITGPEEGVSGCELEETALNLWDGRKGSIYTIFLPDVRMKRWLRAGQNMSLQNMPLCRTDYFELKKLRINRYGELSFLPFPAWKQGIHFLLWACPIGASTRKRRATLITRDWEWAP